MSEAFRFLNEYGDLSRLPLFNQPTYAATPAASAVDTPVVASPPVNTDVDWAIVSALRAQASEQLSQAVASDRSRLDKAAQQELGRSIVLDLIESAMADAVDAGHRAWSLARQQATAQAVFDSLFRLGRLQPLVDDDSIENIVIVGYDNVLLELVDGTLVDGPTRCRLRPGADRLPRLPGFSQRGQRAFLLRGPTAAPPAGSMADPAWLLPPG